MNNNVFRTDGMARLIPDAAEGQGLLHFVERPLLELIGSTKIGKRVDGRSLLVDMENALAAVLQKVAEEKRPPILDLISANTEAPAGSETIAFREITGGGEMAPLAPGATNMPLVRESGAKVSINNLAHSLGFGYSYQELLKVAIQGLDLSSRGASLVRRGYEERRERMLFFGDLNYDIKGICNSDRISRARLTENGVSDTDALIPDGTGAATAAQIRTGILRFINDVAEEASYSIDGSGLLAMPPKLYRYLMQTPLDATNRITIGEEIQRLTGVRFVESVRLRDVDGSLCGLTAGSSYQFMALLNADPMVMEQALPHPHQFFAVQQSGMNFVVPSYAEIGDVLVYDPKACRVGWYQSA